jgi:uncharacterized protein YerC
MLGGTLLAWINSKAYLVVSLQARLHFEGMLLEGTTLRKKEKHSGECIVSISEEGFCVL